jgi:hypothetical protein
VLLKPVTRWLSSQKGLLSLAPQPEAHLSRDRDRPTAAGDDLDVALHREWSIVLGLHGQDAIALLEGLEL